MKSLNNSEWFWTQIVPNLNGYEVKHMFFETGDFGSLDQIVFDSDLKGGVIDFWGSGWLGIHLMDYVTEEELLNVFLEPEKEVEQENALDQLKSLLVTDSR